LNLRNLHFTKTRTMKLQTLITISTCLFIELLSFSQETELDVRTKVLSMTEVQLLAEASMYTQDGFLYFAEILTDKLITFKPESPNYNYRKGYLSLEIRKDYVSAIPFLEKAVKSVSSNYDMYSTREKDAPTDALYHLASCYHLNQQIDKAEEYYNKFISESKKNSELIPVTKLKLTQCQVAKQQIAAPVNVFLRNIGTPVNTAYPEYSPVVSLDGSALYFTSRRPWANGETDDFKDEAINQYPEDVYVSYSDFDSSWTEPVRLEFCMPSRNEATAAVSSDEREIYLYEDTTGFGDIYYTDFYHAKFQDIKKLELEGVNTDDWETHAMMSHDKQMFFFTSDREGGYGGRDIYMLKLEGDQWSKPINLGPRINGPNDEDAPFISIDNKTLYFASNGAKSIGGFDILYSSMSSDGTWEESKNIGFPFNSTNDDIFYTTTIDGLKGYMTSFRNGGFGDKDIYEIHNEYLGVNNVAVLKGRIKTADDKPIPEDFAINIRLICVDCDNTNAQRLIYPRLRDGVFVTALQPCKTYRLEYMNVTDKKIMGEDGFTTECTQEYQEIYKELILDVDKRTIVIPSKEKDPIETPEFQPLEFMHYFTYNKNVISTSEGALKVFVEGIAKQIANGRESIVVSIYSSASNVPTSTYVTNQNLAHVRAENIKKELAKYFDNNPNLKGKVTVIVGSELVQGPDYEKDAGNRDKYKPFQYVGLKTN
jgi:tetratricopeptide (TPR) repeat protein